MNFLASTTDFWPLAVLFLSVAFVITGISVLRLHPFLALILAALLAGVLAKKLPYDVSNPKLVAAELEKGTPVDQMPVEAAEKNKIREAVNKGKWVRAIELTAEGFGRTAGGIAIVIGMATIIGMCLMESGAADKVVRRFLGVMGESRAGIALLVATYFLSIPIFFDSMFMLMIPIAMALALRTGKDFTLYTMAICAGGVITHSLTVPHPGPLFVVDDLKIDVGLSLWIGIAVGLVPAAAAWFVVKKINEKTPIPLRELPSAPLSAIRRVMDKDEKELPSLTASILPIILPILLISATSVMEIIRKNNGYHFENAPGFIAAKQTVDFIGNKNFALVIGAALSLWLLWKQKRRHAAPGEKVGFRKISEMMSKPLETGGVIILITAAGGAFGYMLTRVGVGDAVGAWAKSAGITGVGFLALAYFVAVLIRVAQGSATVAMQTASGIVAAILAATPSIFQQHPIFLFLAIAFGAICCSWMNDSGFWVVSRLSGFTEKETLRTWTVLLTAISIVGFLFTLLLALLLPGWK